MIDHVVLSVEDLGDADLAVRERFGLESHHGGRHVGHGTSNRIVPLGSSYLELVAVVDPEEAAASSFGRWVASKASEILTPHALCLRTDDLDAVSGRLGIEPIAMTRARPDGTELRWRLAGLEQMVSLGVPFYIEWDIDPSHHPSAGYEGVEASLEVTITGDRDRLTEWTAGSKGVSVEEGEPGMVSVTIHLSDRSFDL